MLEQRPGWQAVVRPLVQLTFYQTLRTFMSRAESVAHGQGDASFNLVTDPAIGLVVGLLHGQPGDPWTVATLAKSINMSRSAFSERFRDAVGQPPLQYLTTLRMQRAGELLATTDLGVKQIANVVGYESPSSFTNASRL